MNAPFPIPRNKAWRRAFLFGLIVFLTVSAALLLFYAFARSSLIGAARTEVQQLAAVAAVQVDGDLHRTLISNTQAGSATHLQLLTPLVKFHRATKDVIYVYTAILKDQRAYFVLGTDYLYRVDGDNLPPDPIMKLYSGNDKGLLFALQNQVAQSNEEPVQETFRSYITAYHPFVDSKGQFAGVVGVDMWTRDLEQRLWRLNLALLLLMSLNAFVSWLIGRIYLRLRERAFAQRKLEGDLALTQDAHEKASSAAALASVVAHEFSQHLTVATGHVDLAQQGLLDNSNIQSTEQLQHAKLALSRATDSLEQVRSLSADNFATVHHHFVNDLILQAIERLRRRGLQVARIQIINASPLKCVADATRLSSAIGHLLRNALETNTAVQIELLSEINIDQSWHHVFPECSLPSPKLMVVISDFGTQWSEERKQRLGQSFFSSKGNGYGLGLAVVRSTLHVMPGALLVRRENEKTQMMLVLQAHQ